MHVNISSGTGTVCPPRNHPSSLYCMSTQVLLMLVINCMAWQNSVLHDNTVSSALGFNTPPPPQYCSVQGSPLDHHHHIVKAFSVSLYHFLWSLQSVEWIWICRWGFSLAPKSCRLQKQASFYLFKAFEFPLPRSTITNALRIHSVFGPLAKASEGGREQSVDNLPPTISPALSRNGPFLSQLTRPTYHVFPIALYTLNTAHFSIL